jgi:ribosomal protein S27E
MNAKPEQVSPYGGEPQSMAPSVKQYAPLNERQGVFAHSFKCLECSLEFAIFSWWPDRHTVTSVTCPECAKVTPKNHWMAVASESPTMVLDGSSMEIFDLSPIGGQAATVQADSSAISGALWDGNATMPDPRNIADET